MFVATNVDDILLLAAFFADPKLSRRAIVSGQFVGIALLTVASALAAFAAVVLPPLALRALGLIPLGLGLWKLFQLWRGVEDDDDDAAITGARERSQFVAVTLVTLANGADNIAVYVPVFAQDRAIVPIAAAVFLVLTAVWCGLGALCVRNPWIGPTLQRHGRVVLPGVLIAVGLFILL